MNLWACSVWRTSEGFSRKRGKSTERIHVFIVLRIYLWRWQSCVGVKSNLIMIRQRFFHFFIFSLHAKKKLGLFEKNLFSLLICLSKLSKKRRKNLKKATKREFLSIFFQTQEIQVLEKSNEKKSYASMAIIWP